MSIATTPDERERPLKSEIATVATRGRDEGLLHTAVIASFAEVEAILPDWTALHDRSGTTNPFTHPSWLLTWASHFVSDGNLHLITAHRDGALVGIAPFYWVDFGPQRRLGFKALHPLGNGPSAQFTEMTGVLVDLDDHRPVLAAMVAFLQTKSLPWDWTKVTLDSQQGWFEPQWLKKRAKHNSPFVVQHGTSAYVILELPDSWEAFLRARKRNVRESIRRSFNRLEKRVGEWSVETVAYGPELDAALDRLAELHAALSAMKGKPKHPSAFEERSTREFYFAATAAMIECGRGEVSLLRCRGEVVAGMVAFRSGSQVFVSTSASDPNVWDLGPGTILICELARREIDRGTKGINLSSGPNQSKLRWSEKLQLSSDFMIVGPTRQSCIRFKLFSLASKLAAISRAREWNIRDES